jgi:predicted MFS family arabinose efflux permease
VKLTNTSMNKFALPCAIALLSCAAYSGLFSMPLWIGGVIDSYDISSTLAGYMGSTQLFASVIAALLAASRIDKFGLTHVIASGLAVIVAANFISATTDNTILLFAGRGISGFGEGLLLASLNNAISRTDTPDKYFAISQTSIALFGILLFAATPHSITQFGVSGVFIMVVITASIGFLALLIFNFSSIEAIKCAIAPTAVNTKRYLLPLLSLGVLFIGCQGAWAYMERMGVEKSLSIQEISFFLIIGQLLSLAAPFSATRFAAKFGRKMSITMGLIISGSAVLLASQKIANESFFVAAGIFQFGTLFIVTSFYGFLAAIDSTGSSVTAAPAYLSFGSALGPAAMAGILRVEGYPELGFVIIVIYIIAVALLYAFSFDDNYVTSSK